MGYGSIDIAQVGPAEYPLIDVLRRSIDPADVEPIEQAVRNGADLLTLIAHLEGNPIGHLVAFGDKSGIFTIESLGVLVDYRRRQGIGTRMIDWAAKRARARGYREIKLRRELEAVNSNLISRLALGWTDEAGEPIA